MELVDIVDENNKLTGQVEDRWVAYNKGLWRRTVSCWIMNEKGEVLLQKRTANKIRNPNKWAKTGGQVDSGETVEEAIKAELLEESGLAADRIKIVSRKIASSPGCVSETVTIAIAYIDNYEIKVKPVSDGGVIVDRILVKRNDVYTWLRNKENEGYAMTASTLAALYYLSEESK